MKVILITGTPGVGKSTVSAILKKRLDALLVDINKLVGDEGLYIGYDRRTGSKIVDLDVLCNRIDNIIQNVNKTVIIEGHLSHYFENADLVIVLRTHPEILRKRLKHKGFSEDKIRENIEAEAIGVCSYEAFKIHGERTNEIDTSNISPEEVANKIIEIIKGRKKFSVGKVDFLE